MAATFFSNIVSTHLRNDLHAYKINFSDVLSDSSSIPKQYLDRKVHFFCFLKCPIWHNQGVEFKVWASTLFNCCSHRFLVDLQFIFYLHYGVLLNGCNKNVKEPSFHFCSIFHPHFFNKKNFAS